MNETPPPAFSLNKESSTSWWLALVGAIASLVFLANPGWGVFFEIPDNLPLIGNLDETLVTGILIACLARLGINIIPGMHRNRNRDTVIDQPPSPKKPNGS